MQIQESKSSGEMSIGLVGVKLQCSICHLQTSIQMIIKTTRIVVGPVALYGFDKAEHGMGGSKSRIEIYRFAQKGLGGAHRVIGGCQLQRPQIKVIVRHVVGRSSPGARGNGGSGLPSQAGCN